MIALTHPYSPALPADRDPALAYLAALPSPRSRRVQAAALHTLAAHLTGAAALPPDATLRCPWWELRYAHTQALRARLIAAGYAPATVNRHLAALRGVLKACWGLGLLGFDDYRRAADLATVRGARLPAGRDIPPHELRALLLSCYADGLKGVRDLAVLGLLATTGIRRAEFEALDLADFDPATGALRVQGKGGKERVVCVVNTARAALDRWLRYRGDAPGPLFLALEKGGRLTRRRMSATAAYALVRDRAEAGGLGPLSPRDFRRAFIGNMLDAGVDAVTIMKITGHASVEMLKRYDRRPEHAKAEAQARIDLPI
jgi:integrase